MIIGIFLWLLAGAVAAGIMAMWDYNRGKDFTIGELGFTIMGLCFGPVMLVIVFIVFLDTHKKVVVFKGKDLLKKDSEESSEPDLTKSTLEDDKT